VRQRGAAPLAHRVAWIGIAWAGLVPTTAAPTGHIAWIGIGHAIATTAPAGFITWVGIARSQRTPATCYAATIPDFVIWVGIRLTAAALFRWGAILAGQVRFGGHG
jgi:hypothetical protein